MPTVIFGSSFPGDKSIAAIYREIARIKQAMALGGCIMLVHAEDVYESLYDMLNQFYTQALCGTNRPQDLRRHAEPQNP